MGKRLNIKAGDRFGKLTVVGEAEPNVTPCGTIQRKFNVKCDCEKCFVISLNALTRGAKKSCGCDYVSWARKYSDEQKNSFLYSTWKGMRQRCYDPNSKKYAAYGGRGIRMCDEWEHDYVAFYNWAINNGAKNELTIDRINVNGDYCPENCRWADAKTQSRNKQYNRYIEYNGTRKLVLEWSEELGIPYDTIRARLDQHGYTVGQALGFEHRAKNVRDERPETRKCVLQYSLDGILLREWDSVIEIQDKLGFRVNSIRRCCEGYSNSSHGYKWKYKDGVKGLGHLKNIAKPVLQYTLEGHFVAEYANSRIASKQTGIDASGISKFCSDNAKDRAHCGGYLWMYKKDDDILETIPALEDYTQYHRLTFGSKTMRVVDWSEITGIRATTILSRLSRGWSIGQALGFEHHTRKNAKNTKAILQYDKDMNLIKEWHSLHFIRKETGRSKQTIMRYINSGELDTRGYYWRLKEDNA